MRTLVIGGGEIGNSLFNVLSSEYECDIYDIKYNKNDLCELEKNQYDIIHICFPYNENFIEQVIKYKELFKPKYVVVHSTVPVGTCSDLGAVHSPCLGIHPDLTVSMKTFTKFLGGKDAGAVADYFRRAGMTVYITDKSETTELSKIMCTTYYGMCIEFTKEMKRLCDRFGVPFEFWNLWINNYNQGYERLNHPEYVRPNLVPNMQKIAGHCVMPNTELLENKFTKFLKENNNEDS